MSTPSTPTSTSTSRSRAKSHSRTRLRSSTPPATPSTTSSKINRPPYIINVADAPITPYPYLDNTHNIPSYYSCQRRSLSQCTNINNQAKLGCSHIILPHQHTAYMYHYHTNVEEAIYILQGNGTLRLNNILYDVKAGTYIALLSDNEAYAHQLFNTSDHDDLIYLCFSTDDAHDVVRFIDNRTIAVSTRSVHSLYDTDQMTSLWSKHEIPQNVFPLKVSRSSNSNSNGDKAAPPSEATQANQLTSDITSGTSNLSLNNNNAGTPSIHPVQSHQLTSNITAETSNLSLNNNNTNNGSAVHSIPSQTTPAVIHPNIVHLDRLSYTPYRMSKDHAAFFYQANRIKLGKEANGVLLACSYNIVPSNSTAFPLHSHDNNDEAIFILSGVGQLRINTSNGADDEYSTVGAGDYISLPRGRFAHQLWNVSQQALVYLCAATSNLPDVAYYPASNKHFVISKTLTHILRPIQQIDYYDGEVEIPHRIQTLIDRNPVI